MMMVMVVMMMMMMLMMMMLLMMLMMMMMMMMTMMVCLYKFIGNHDTEVADLNFSLTDVWIIFDLCFLMFRVTLKTSICPSASAWSNR